MSARAACAAIAGAAAAAYGMILWAPPIYDEAAFITYHPVFAIPFGAFLRGLFSERSLEFSGLGTYQPLPQLLHYATYPSTAAAHALDVAVHALTGCLVFLLAKKLSGRDVPALLAGLLYVVFPPLTEAVNIAAYSSHELALLFTLGCLLSWLRAHEPGARRRRWLALSLLSFAAGLASKETAVVAPALLALHTLTLAPPGERAARARGGVAFALVLGAYLLIRFAWLRPIPTDALPPHLGRAWTAFGWYLRLLAVPAPLCLERSVIQGSALQVLLYALPVAFAAFLLLARWDAYALFCLVWIPIALAPVLYYIPAYSRVVDRYVTLAAPGLCLLAAHPALSGRRRYALYALLLAWGLLTLRRNALYLEPEALFEQTAACAPANPRAQAVLAAFRLDSGDYARAAAGFARALELDPGYAAARTGLELAEQGLGRALP